MLPRVTLLGVGIHPFTWSALLTWIRQRLENPTVHSTIAYANVHVLNEASRDDTLRTFLNQVDICYCDGNGVVLGARMLGQHLPERMTGADWIWDLAAEAAAEGWRIWWIGGEPGVTETAAGALRNKHPDLVIGSDHGFHARDGVEDQESIERINTFKPDIVLVGMGTPIQEAWVQQRRNQIQAPIVWCLGATADFVSGNVHRPGPKWLVDNHEWLSRLLADPQRLWRRYLIGNSKFLIRVARDRLRS